MPKSEYEESYDLKGKKVKMLSIGPGKQSAEVSSQNYFIETIIRKFDEKRKKNFGNFLN
jgi:hypothetical protein